MSTHQHNPRPHPGDTVNRRTLAKGVAWTAPAIMVAAAPSLAASSSDPEEIDAHADKCPGASDVPGGWPKHGYRLVVTGTAEAPESVLVQLNNGKPAAMVAGPTPTAPGEWEYVLDAKSSTSTLTVWVKTANRPLTLVTVKAHPHCEERPR